MQKKIACIVSGAPYRTNHAHAALDIIMASATFDHPPTLFFIDHGILQLLSSQQATTIRQPNIGRHIKSFHLFDINTIYICQQSLQYYHVKACDLLLSNGILFEKNTLQTLLQPFSIVLSF